MAFRAFRSLFRAEAAASLRLPLAAAVRRGQRKGGAGRALWTSLERLCYFYPPAWLGWLGSRPAPPRFARVCMYVCECAPAVAPSCFICSAGSSSDPGRVPQCAPQEPRPIWREIQTAARTAGFLRRKASRQCGAVRRHGCVISGRDDRGDGTDQRAGLGRGGVRLVGAGAKGSPWDAAGRGGACPLPRSARDRLRAYLILIYRGKGIRIHSPSFLTLARVASASGGRRAGSLA